MLPSYDNLSATSDPSASNDNTQGYTVGSRWVNSTTPNSNADWQLMAHIFKFGATGSNTQYSQATAVRGGVHGGIGLPVFPTALESSAIVIALTGSSYTTGVANDVIATWFEVNAIN